MTSPKLMRTVKLGVFDEADSQNFGEVSFVKRRSEVVTRTQETNVEMLFVDC